MVELGSDSGLRALLDRLEDHWRRQGYAFVDGLQLGLSEDEVRSRCDNAGIQAPAEAVIWWGWHNGAIPPRGSTARVPPTPYWYLEIEGALETYAFNVTEGFPGDVLPILLLEKGLQVAIHLDVEPGQRSAVREFSYEDFDLDSDYVIASSLEELVARWVTAFDEGLVWRGENDLPEWDYQSVTERFGRESERPGVGVTTGFGVRVLRPWRHDPPPMEID